MQKAFEKIVERLEEKKKEYLDSFGTHGENELYGIACGFGDSITIVNQVAEEYEGVTTCYLGRPCEYQNEDINVESANEQLMKNLIEAKKNCGEDSNCSECIFCHKEDVCYLQELQISGGNDGWIPCSERLPEEKENPITRDYYVYPVMVDLGKRSDIRYYGYGDGHWWHGLTKMDGLVTHWMDIKPYQPKGE